MECDLPNAKTKVRPSRECICLFHNGRVEVCEEQAQKDLSCGALEVLGQVPGNVGNIIVTAMPGKTKT